MRILSLFLFFVMTSPLLAATDLPPKQTFTANPQTLDLFFSFWEPMGFSPSQRTEAAIADEFFLWLAIPENSQKLLTTLYNLGKGDQDKPPDEILDTLLELKEVLQETTRLLYGDKKQENGHPSSISLNSCSHCEHCKYEDGLNKQVDLEEEVEKRWWEIWK